jgi:hypothetical protein
MKILRAIAALSLLACGLLTVPVMASAPIKGNWSLSPSNEPGKVHFAIIQRSKRNNSHHESEWSVDEFQGLDLKSPGKRDVAFVIARDAGRFDCEGYLKDGEGAGSFLFTPDPEFAGEMRALGFDVDEHKQFVMASLDVTVDHARQMKSLRFSGLDTDHLIATRIFSVTPQFVNDLRKEGLPLKSVDKVIAFKVHGVSLDLVREFRKRDFDVNEDQLVAFRVHKVTPEYITKIEKLGFQSPSADQLVAMRVHGVTPEFVAEMKSRGLKDLTLDKLVNLRVHGIE